MKKLLIFMIISLSFFTSLQAAQPTMTMTDIHGKTYTITGTDQGLKVKGLEGKVIILEFFGHRCPPCLATIPHLINLQNNHKDEVAVIAVEVQGYNNTQLKQFAKTKGINYIVATDANSGNLVTYISQRARWQGSIPFTLAIDKKGEVQFVHAGMLPESALESLVKQLK